MRTVLVTGAGGQLGWELQRCHRQGLRLVALPRAELDVTRPDQVRRALEHIRPQVVVNAAAYTAVDRAESDPEAAFLINRDGAAHLAQQCSRQRIRLLHVSTDFVFDGNASRPYKPTDPTHPLGVYGRSKRAGEEAVLELHPGGSTVVRTAWLYSEHGSNFVKTMLKLFSQREEVAVVCDQVGTPTWAHDLARFLSHLAFLDDAPSIVHFTDAGVASWYDLAVAVEEETRAARGRRVRVRPIPSAAYPTPAKRPNYSVLDKEETWKLWPEEPLHWRETLRRMLSRLP
ncbi:dTDP-4-dehydrorhamnose reductase [Desulfacinum hydrothermale DSM 13146]|uniref:dTDP-4-dehydrorhamnose reductase n=1 Tax=Desulfacinum hydrothermale DSM 13146 TaxID=1121390 RepID=A0A1W1X2G8_9BACT|nr:dTDP-4-dehydrorhamnose reductase [Desulfacinum hydrothermale]SMC18023.1 dTDP-4-dehydrorhamnose reductase [Desulfacinum hydrothermale DSM 13146]